MRREGYRSRVWWTLRARWRGTDLSRDVAVQACCGMSDSISGSMRWSRRRLLTEVQTISQALKDILAQQNRECSRDGHVPRIGILLGQTLECVAGILGSMAAGAAFVPLSSSWPLSRLQYIAKDADLDAVLCTGATTKQSLVESFNCSIVEYPHSASAQQHLDIDESAHAQGADRDYCFLPFSYILYTSGSTGQPKGVVGTEVGVLNRCEWFESLFSLGDNDAVAWRTPTSFVDSLWEIFGPLFVGSKVVNIPSNMTPNKFVQCLAECRITHLVGTPSLLISWMEAFAELKNRGIVLWLRYLISSGEALRVDLLCSLRKVLPDDCKIFNIYGTTETAADCTWFDTAEPLRDANTHSNGQQHVPVGRPICGFTVAVVQRIDAETTRAAASECQTDLPQRGALPEEQPPPLGPGLQSALYQPVALGVCGEVWVSGLGLATGYTSRELGQPRFVDVDSQAVLRSVEDPKMSASAAGPCAKQRSPQGNTVFFRTGDLGIVDDKGLLTIVGRADLQVKVNGVRVDVLEVETRLEEHPMVTSAAVKAWPTPVAGGQVLVAYIVPTALPAQYNAGTGSAGANDFESQLLFDQLRSWLGSSLPQAAIPSSFQIATQLPKSCAGKVARGQLPPPNWASHKAHWKPKWGQQNSTVAPPHPVESVDCQPVHSTDARHETLVTCSQAPPEHGGLRFSDGTVKGNTSQGQKTSCGLEPMVLSAFADVLCWGDFNQRKVPNLEPTSNFFQHGGTSLSAISLASKLKVEPSVVHALPTPRELAQFIAGGHDVALKHLHSQHLRNEQDTRMPSFVWLEHQTRLCPTSQVGAVAPTWTLRRRVVRTGGEYVAGDPILDAVDGRKQAATTTVTCMQRSKKPKLMDSHSNQQYHQATELTSVQHCFVYPKDSNGRTVSDQANFWNSRLEHGDLRGCHCYCLSGLSSSKLEGGHGHVGMQATGRDAWPLSADGDVILSLIAAQAPRPPQEGHTSQPPCHNNCDDEGRLSAQWSHQMSQCVDAPPVVILFPATENEIRCGACASCACGLALASSHGGDVACLSLTCGDVLWTTNVGNRADAGLTVTSDMQSVAVACRIGTIYFLRLVDGIVLGQVNVGGEIRSPPLVDPWEGYIWVGTHGRDVVAAMSPGIIVLTHPVQEPISCSIAFGGLDRCVYVATLGGTAMALRFKGGRRGAAEVCTKWAHELGAPIFSSPQVDGATGIVVCATVKGTVVAISASSGDLVWARNLHATVFAPASVSPKGMEECVLVPTHAGSVHCLALATGEVMAVIHLHEGPISNPVSAGFCLPCLHSSSCPLMSGAASARSCGSGGREDDCGAVGPESVCLVAVCNNAGCLVILKMVHAPELAVQVIASLEFPGEVFSSPTIVAGKVVLGCRDDRLYCVDLGAMIQSSFNKESQ